MQTEENLSEAIQDYLKAIYELSTNGEPTSTNQIAERLKVAPASVTGMLKRLASMEPPLVDYHKHHGVQLTAEGERISLQILRKHRLLEQFMVQILGYTWDEIHEEAERLEHAVSFRFVDRLGHLLGEPDFDPHGDPIPGRDLQLPEMKVAFLSDVSAGEQTIVRRVLNGNPALLRYLSDIGVQPGAKLEVIAQVPFDGTVRIRVDGKDSEQVLGPEINRIIQVEVVN
jgi:DtxR family Mn-dependent transcriptional regulator